MLNYIWAAMILIGVVYGGFTGKMPEITNAALDSSKEAVTLCITMLGIMSLWTGIMEVAKEAGIIKAATKKIEPFIRFLFPRIPEGHPAKEHITTNVIANILGLGWAATPAGLKAMKELEGLNKTPGIASNEMCTFLIINISSLQLIPVNIITYRSQYGSVNPAAIIAPAIIATCFSTLVGVIFAKAMDIKAR
ncbi:MAG: nucleoside recognition protein [Clostridiales bacterium]|nr:nucleoside recognition protein [Clostridiales bacterium]